PSTSDSAICPRFFCRDTAPTATYALSLHDALPISPPARRRRPPARGRRQVYVAQGQAGRIHGRLRHRAGAAAPAAAIRRRWRRRSEEHTSELQSREKLVCRLLLEKKKPTTAVMSSI